MIDALKKVVFLGGKDIGHECLKFLIKEAKKLNRCIVGVDTSPQGEKIRLLLQEHELEYLDGVIPVCDIIISVQYHRILSKKEIQLATERAINLHMAPLPEYRGCNQFSFAIMDEVSTFGTTLHEIVPGIDSGPIIADNRFDITPDIWVKELYKLTYNASIDLFKECLAELVSGNYCAVDQKIFLSKRKTSFHLRTEVNELKKINLNWDKSKINKHLRATMMPGFDPPYVMVDNEKIYFKNKI